MRITAIVSIALALAACAPRMADPPLFLKRLPDGNMIERSEDVSYCRNQARAIFNGTYPFWDIYADCMISKGYTPA